MEPGPERGDTSGAGPVDEALWSSLERLPRPGRDLGGPHLKALILSSLFAREASPPRIGRFTLLRLLGEGGMGVVYAAYDADLDRQVAIKLLRAGPTAQSDLSRGPEPGDADPAAPGEARARLLREAQALAKFNHPHIVAIYDVGEHQGAVWLAMEYVDGVTLSAWSRQRRRSWREVLAVMTPAAHGLSAAHDAGLVHRDIKPDNIMIGGDGRVRVMDLGLARALGGDDEPAVGAAALDAPSAAVRPLEGLAARMTRAGSVVGTPAYMSPEQFRGQTVDARADVFSFCVTLWEALMGERPFAGGALTELAASVLSGAVRPVPRDPYARRVPGWLRRVCLRGLAAAPERRFASMKALLDALSRGRARARARRWLAGAVAAAAVAASVVAYQRHDRAGRIATCEAAGARIVDVWSDEARTGVREGIVATGLGYAAVTADKVMPFLDAQAEAWREHRTRACLLADVEGTLDAEQLDRAVWCLDERRMELAALLTELSRADATVVQEAVTAAAGLQPVSPCTDEQVLAALPAPPADMRVKADEVSAMLSQVRTLLSAGKYAEGLELTRTALAEAEALGWPPMIVAARQLEGTLLERTGAFADAESASVSAYMEAAKVRAWDVAARAATVLVTTVGLRQARHAEARVWAGHAEVAVLFAGDPLELREASRLNNLAGVYWATGEYAEAKALYERVLAISQAALGPEHPEEADALNNLALIHHTRGEYAEARALFERALAVREKALGPGHPEVATCLHNLAGVHWAMGGYAEAKALYERALVIVERALGAEHPRTADALTGLAGVYWATGEYAEAKALLGRVLVIVEKALGPEHPSLAETLNNLGSVHQMRGEYAEAKALLKRALALRDKALGPEHPATADSLHSLGSVSYVMGEYAEARALFERALTLREKALGPEHPGVAETLHNLAELHANTGRSAEAKALYERALALEEKALGAEHPGVAETLEGLGSLALARGQAREAQSLLERAVAIYDAHEGVQPGELKTRFSLARALVLVGGDRTRALAEARSAADGLREPGEGHANLLAEVEAFLARHVAAPEDGLRGGSRGRGGPPAAK